MLIDLSYPLRHGDLSYPNDPQSGLAAYHSAGSIGYNLSRIAMSSYQGTHLDAPFHFFDGRTLARSRWLRSGIE
jgi:arylformamidase